MISDRDIWRAALALCPGSAAGAAVPAVIDDRDMAGLVDPGRDPIYPRHYRATALLPASVCYRGVAVASKKLSRKQR